MTQLHSKGTHGSIRAKQWNGGDWQLMQGRETIGTLPSTVNRTEVKRIMDGFVGTGKLIPAPTVTSASPLERLEHGPNAVHRVSEATRFVATEEARQGGEMERALLRHASSEVWPDAAREVFAKAFGSVDDAELVEAKAPWVQSVLDKVADSPTWSALQTMATGDAWAAGLATARILDKVPAPPADDPEQLQKEADEADEGPAKDEAQAKADAAAAAATAFVERIEQSDAISAAVDKAFDEVVQGQRAVATLAGLGGGVLSAIKAPDEELRAALRKSPNLAKVANIAGKLRPRAVQKQRRKVRGLPEQIVGVTVGDELSRLLGSELMLLADADLEVLPLRRLLESQAAQYDVEGTETADKGPIVMAVDCSGSMFTGTPHTAYDWAVGCALALLEVCCIQRRGFVYYPFDTRPLFTVRVPNARKLKLDDLLKIVGRGSGGGTSLQAALNHAQDVVQEGEWKKSDLVIITDGQDSAWDLSRLRALGVDVYAIAVGCSFSVNLREGLSGYVEVSARDVADCSDKADLVFGL